VIYEDGVFKPLKKVKLPEKTRGKVIVEEKKLTDDVEELSKDIDEILEHVEIDEDPLKILLEMRNRSWD